MYNGTPHAQASAYEIIQNRPMPPSLRTQWITQLLADEPPRSKSLITTIFGDAIVPHGGVAWLGSLIELLMPFGVNERLLRTSVFRLAQEGWVGAEREGRRSSYAITPEAMTRFARAERRIYAPPLAQWDGNWTLVIGAASTLDPVARSALRKQLQWEGYYMLAPGLAAHPQSDPDLLKAILHRTGMADKVYVCRATGLPGVGGKALTELVAQGWDLTGVAQGYRHFIAQFAPLKTLLVDEPAVDAEQAFVMRTLLIHAYRRVQLHDPQLPAQLLPANWPGTAAYALTRELYRVLWLASEQHVLTTLRKEAPLTSEANSAFYARLGGLKS